MRRILALCALVAASTACVIQTSDGGGCEPASPPAQCVSDKMHVDAKSIASWSAFGRDHGASLVGEGQPCTFAWYPGEQYVPREGHVVTDPFLTISCGSGDTHLEFTLTGLGDPRTWPDTRTLPGPCLLRSGISVYGGGASCDESSVCGTKVTITTETRAGTETTAPSLVTPDYARSFRIDIDATHPALTSCKAEAPSFSAHVWLTQTAADWKSQDCPVMCE